MRARRSAQEKVSEVARRRLQQLSAELAELRPDAEALPHELDASVGDGRPGEPDAIPDVPGGQDGLVASRRQAGRHAQRPPGPATCLARWGQDRLPPALQGQVQLGPGHLAVLVVVVVVAVGMTGWWLSRSPGGGETVPRATAPPTTLVDGAGPSPGSPLASANAAATGAQAASGSPGSSGSTSPGAARGGHIVVDVAGKVRRPGIATLPLGSRVVDAVRAAGGPRRGASLGSLNLARVLADGEQVLVGVAPPPGVAASAASAPTSELPASPMVNLNTASQSQLEELPDVGPVTAQAILQFRVEHGAFTAVEQLLDVSGIGEATLAKLAPFVTL